MTSTAEFILGNEWRCGQDTPRANQLAADRKRDAWSLEDLAKAGRETWERGAEGKRNTSVGSACPSMGEVSGAASLHLHSWPTKRRGYKAAYISEISPAEWPRADGRVIWS